MSNTPQVRQSAEIIDIRTAKQCDFKHGPYKGEIVQFPLSDIDKRINRVRACLKLPKCHKTRLCLDSNNKYSCPHFEKCTAWQETLKNFYLDKQEVN